MNFKRCKSCFRLMLVNWKWCPCCRVDKTIIVQRSDFHTLKLGVQVLVERCKQIGNKNGEKLATDVLKRNWPETV